MCVCVCGCGAMYGTPARAVLCSSTKEEEGNDESGTVLLSSAANTVGMPLDGVPGYRLCFFFPLNLTPCRRCSISVPNACVNKMTV